MTTQKIKAIKESDVYIYIKYRTRNTHGQILIKQLYYDNYLSKKKRKLFEDNEILKLCLLCFKDNKLHIVRCTPV